jgi:deoxycytidylate deaminase
MAVAHGIKKIIYDEEYDKDLSSLSLADEFNIELTKQSGN